MRQTLRLRFFRKLPASVPRDLSPVALDELGLAKAASPDLKKIIRAFARK